MKNLRKVHYFQDLQNTCGFKGMGFYHSFLKIVGLDWIFKIPKGGSIFENC